MINSITKNNQQNSIENKLKQESNKTNKFKTRIIEAEINSGLFLHILIYYNIFSTAIIFFFQIFTWTFKVYMFFSQ